MAANFIEAQIEMLKNRVQNIEGGTTNYAIESSPNTITGFWSGTQVQYDAIVTKDPAVIYFTTP